MVQGNLILYKKNNDTFSGGSFGRSWGGSMKRNFLHLHPDISIFEQFCNTAAIPGVGESIMKAVCPAAIPGVGESIMKAVCTAAIPGVGESIMKAD